LLFEDGFYLPIDFSLLVWEGNYLENKVKILLCYVLTVKLIKDREEKAKLMI